MLYLAVLDSDDELSEDIIEKMKDTIFAGYEEYPSNDNAKYSFTIESVMKAPKEIFENRISDMEMRFKE